MVNKKDTQKDKTGTLVPVFLVCRRICLLICCMAALIPDKTNAQNPSAYYVSTKHPTGILYFIRPQTCFKNPKTNTDWILDVTYLNSKDSATINFSYFDSENINLETITISYNNWQYQATLKRIFVEADKKQWHYRYTFNIPFSQLVLFYRTKAPVITISTNSSRTIPIHTVKKWEKNADVNNRIIQIIQKNKN